MKGRHVAIAAFLASAVAVRSQDSAVATVQANPAPFQEAEVSSDLSGNGTGEVQTVGSLPEDFGGAADDGPSLFAGNADEDPGILEIKRIARELESRRALMIQLAGLQRDLIDFAMADPAAAWRSRIPSSVCEYALKRRFCDAMTASFRKEGGNGR